MAHSALSMIKLYFEWDFEGARLEAEQAVALNPHDLVSRHVYADYLMAMGRFDESLEQARLGRDANPESPLAQFIVLFHTVAARRPEAVRGEARTILKRFPSLAPRAHSALGDLLWREGKYEEALAEYKLSVEDAGLNQMFEEAFRRAGPRAALLALAERMLAEAEKAGRPPGWLGIAGLYAEAGDADHAFGALEKAYAARLPQLLHVVSDPAYDPIRKDPRYDDLMRRIGIPLGLGGASQPTTSTRR